MEKIIRCYWKGIENKNYQKYHDHEWGKLNLDNQYLYEMLVLESFQSGLSWAIILNKRANFRTAFANFNYEKVARFDEKDVEKLLQNQGIIRNHRKIEAAINNAKIIASLKEKGISFADYLQEYVPHVIINHPQTMTDIPAKNELSIQLSKEMKKIGFKFVGPVTVYSFLQAVGLVNDHLESCSFKY